MQGCEERQSFAPGVKLCLPFFRQILHNINEISTVALKDCGLGCALVIVVILNPLSGAVNLG